MQVLQQVFVKYIYFCQAQTVLDVGPQVAM